MMAFGARPARFTGLASLLFVLLTLPCAAQTNSVSTFRTNDLDQTVAVRKRAAIVELNKFFDIKYDKFTDATTISLKKPLVAYDHGEEFSLKFDVYCQVSKSAQIPDTIHFHIMSTSPDWQFLKYSQFIVIWDDKKKDFGEIKDDGDVIGSHVLEQLVVDFSYDEFRQIAFAKEVNAKLALFKLDLTDARKKWRVLIDYFECLKSEQRQNQSKASAKH